MSRQPLRRYTFILSDSARDTVTGDTIKLVGDNEALGKWNVSNGQEMDGKSFPKWTVEVDLNPNEVFCYKYVKVRADGRKEWESCNNRYFLGQHQHRIEDEFNVGKPAVEEGYQVVQARKARSQEEVPEGSHVNFFTSNVYAHLDFVKREFANLRAEMQELRSYWIDTAQALKTAAGEESKIEAQVREMCGHLEDFQAEQKRAQAEQKRALDTLKRNFSDLKLEVKVDRLVPPILDKIKEKAFAELLPRILAQVREDLQAQDPRQKMSVQTSQSAVSEVPDPPAPLVPTTAQ
eukprot:s633_g9.t1